jgi:putative tryptophan/tyrosine transport system substrate-binding protein
LEDEVKGLRPFEEIKQMYHARPAPKRLYTPLAKEGWGDFWGRRGHRSPLAPLSQRRELRHCGKLRGSATYWILLVALIGVVCLTSRAVGQSREDADRFRVYENGTVLDTRTHLMWMAQDFRNLEGRAPENWDEAMAWADKMNVQRYAGYSDWRVPTEAEYKTIYDPQRPRKSYDGRPVGYPEVFADGGGEQLWLNEFKPFRITKMDTLRHLSHSYIIDFRTGKTRPEPYNIMYTHDRMSVRLVRIVPKSPNITVLKSHDLAPFNQALAGFTTACPDQITTYDLGGSPNDAKGVVDRITTAKPQLILAIGPLATQMAQAEFREIPVVFVMAPNPPKDGRNGTNMTGISLHIPIDKQLATYNALLPSIQNIGVIYDPTKTGAMVHEASDVAQKLGLQLHTAPIASSKEVAAALRSLVGTIDALWMLPDETVVTRESFEFLVLAAFKHRLPLLALSDAFVKAGALASVSLDYVDLGRQACRLAQDIASGRQRPAEVDVVPPAKAKLAINLKVAKQIGLTLPQAIVESADQVFQ